VLILMFVIVYYVYKYVHIKSGLNQQIDAS